jgi:hypothetical protein
MTISSGDNTSLDILKVGAVKAMDGDTLLLIATETLHIDRIEEVNHCIDYLECGVALKVKISKEAATINLAAPANDENFPRSLLHMIHIAKSCSNNQPNIVEIVL